MPNVENITGPNHSRGRPFTRETARDARQRRTAKERANASIAEEFRRLVNEMQTDTKGNKMTGAEAIAKSLLKGCLSGNTRAQELALALMGEKPAERISISAPDRQTIERVETALFGGESREA